VYNPPVFFLCPTYSQNPWAQTALKGFLFLAFSSHSIVLPQGMDLAHLLPVIPGHPRGGIRRQLPGVALQLAEVVEGVGAR